MKYSDIEEKNILLSSIPQIYPFVFVNQILKKTKETFITSVDLYPLKKFFDTIKCNLSKYPISLLIEHAAQSMFLHGYYLGKEIQYWDYSYTPIGVLMSIEDVLYSDTDIDYFDTLHITTQLIKYKQKLIYIDVIIESKQKKKIIFSGKFKGMFLKTDLIKETTLNEDTNFINKANHHDLKFYDQKNNIDIFSSTYWFLDGHFPGFPCIPGCFLIDGFIQSCGKKFSMKKIQKIKFKRLATPDNTYKFKSNEIDNNTLAFEIINLKDDSICVEGTIIK